MIFNVASSPGEPVKRRVFLFWRHGCSADLCLQRQKPAMLAQMPLFVYRHFTGASCTTSSDGRFALFSAASTAAFSVASRLSNSSDILFRASSEPPPPSVACCAHRFKVLIYLKRFGAMASTNKSLAQMNKSPKVAAGLVQKMHSGPGNSVRAMLVALCGRRSPEHLAY